MPSFQSSINQALTTGGIMASIYSQSAQGKAAAELRGLKSQQKLLDKQLNIAQEPTTEEGYAYHETLVKKQAELSGKIFEAEPNKANYQDMLKSRHLLDEMDLTDNESKFAKSTKAAVKSDENLTAEQIINAIQKQSVQDRANILKQSSHIQAQAKKEEQQKKYEEARK